jgi:phosphoribosylformylglycinamidine cyclo-ligase
MADGYAESGVDVDVESRAAIIMFEAAKKTFENRKGNIGEIIIPFDDFSGVRAIDVSNLPEGSMMGMGFDGVGTKAEVAQRMNKHDTMAFDLLAMVCDDAILRGAEPVLVGSILDVNTLGTDDARLSIIEQLAKGYVEAAKAANVAIVNGEIAQLSHAVGGYGNGFAYNWGSTLIWFADKTNIFTGKEINLGDTIVVLEEKGFRSNGLSLVRKIFEEHLGDEWHDKDFKGQKLGFHVLTPSIIYTKAFVHMHGGFQTEGTCEIHGAVHITGGGVIEKFDRVLRPSGYGAELNNLLEPCDAMKYCQELGMVADEEAYHVWNMGQGFAIITPDSEKVIEECSKFNIKARVAGKIIEDKKILIKSRGVFSTGGVLEFKIG